MTSPRIAPVDPPYSDSLQKAFDRIMPPGMEPLKIFRTYAHHSELLKRITALGGVLLNQGFLPPRERELILLRTCARWGAGYEWGVHAALFAEHLGFTKEEIAATAGEVSPAPWTPKEQLLLQATDTLITTGRLPDDLWDALAQHYDHQELLEITGVVGCYTAISFMLNACQVEVEEWAPQLPDGSPFRQ